MISYGMKEPTKRTVFAMNPASQADYPVICLCGSTRFRDVFDDVAARLTLHGNIVLSLGVFDKSGDAEIYDIDENDVEKMQMLSDMHKQRIQMADAIYVVNPGGYIGAGTREEIAYAKALGKDVLWLEENAAGGIAMDEYGNIVYNAVV